MWIAIILLFYVTQSHVRLCLQSLALHVTLAKATQFLWFLLLYKDDCLFYNIYNNYKLICVSASMAQSASFRPVLKFFLSYLIRTTLHACWKCGRTSLPQPPWLSKKFCQLYSNSLYVMINGFFSQLNSYTSHTERGQE